MQTLFGENYVRASMNLYIGGICPILTILTGGYTSWMKLPLARKLRSSGFRLSLPGIQEAYILFIQEVLYSIMYTDQIKDSRF